ICPWWAGPVYTGDPPSARRPSHNPGSRAEYIGAMTPEDSGTPAVFDPDSPAEQPAEALQSLIAEIESEISELQFPRFSRDDALNLGLLLVELGKDARLPIAIDISRGEQVLFHVALDGATPDNGHWVKAKRRAAAR